MNTVTPNELNERLEQWLTTHPARMSAEEEALRQEFLTRFPLDTLEQLPLDKYVMGHGDQDNFSYWLEHKTKHLGNILGGNASKFGVYWSSGEQQYVVNSMFQDAEDARRRMLGGIAEAAKLLEAGQVAQADEVGASIGGQRYSMRLKPLSLYFPDLLLPISSPTHLQHFLRLFGQEPAGDQLALNQQLLRFLKTLPAAHDMDSLSLMRFLYDVFPPNTDTIVTARKVWKVALGEQSVYLQTGLDHDVVFIGSRLDNLQAIPRTEMPARLQEAGDEPGFAASAVHFAHGMREGDVVVVNQGMSHVLAVGLVKSDYLTPGSAGNPLTQAVVGDQFPVWAHARQVDWVLTTPVDLPKGVRRLAIQTVAPIPEATFQRILDAYAANDPSAAQAERLKILGWRNGSVLPPPDPKPPLVNYLIELADSSKNMILYGPPGTGKTFVARQFARAWVRNSEPLADTVPTSFTPKHWWQAVAVALADLGTGTVAEIESHAAVQAFAGQRANRHVSQTIWQQLLVHTDPGDTSSNVAQRVRPYIFTRNIEDENRWQLNEEGEVLVAQWQGVAPTGVETTPQQTLLENVTFHPAFTYEEFVEGLRPTASGGGGFEVRDGVFKRLCQRAHEHPEQQFVLLIDEINRADTAKTFGELITLIEDDKRVEPGTLGDHPVTLPYSDAPDNLLSVPGNLCIIGTMNTADRSITLMDVALRRRFTFVEVPPMPELLSGKVDGTSLSPERLLRRLNSRLTELRDKDHQIGHAYLMGETLTAHDLTFRWRHKIVPLLQEYFYAREDDFRELLGESLYRDATREQPLDQAGLMRALLQFTGQGDPGQSQEDNGAQ